MYAVFLMGLLLLNGCAMHGPQSTMLYKGPLAEAQWNLFMLTVYITGGIFVFVGGAMVYFLWKYRERKGSENEPLPDQGHGNPLIEVSLIGVSIFLLVIIAVPTLKGIHMMNTLPVPEDEVIEVNVIGYQWWWEFEYPQLGIRTGNEFAIPTGKVVKLNLISADVIHSFWLPRLSGKTDLIPGRKNWMWIQADEDGHYYGQCAEYCGEAHAYMLFRVDSLNEADWDAWVANHQKPAPLPEENTVEFEGRELFMNKGCLQCHHVEGHGSAGRGGPDLSHFGGRATLGAGWRPNDTQNLHQWIKHSETIKPGNKMYETVSSTMNLTDEDVAKIAAYLQSLKN